jgi:hypothetical protein
MTVRYDAASNSYTVTSAGVSQTFAPGDATSPDGYSFRKVSGTTVDNLSLTQPGTSGSLRYQYVGAGFWQRQATSGGTVATTFNAFTYGVETPDAALPRTGLGTYSVDIVGALNQEGESGPLGLSGTGTLRANFGTGAVSSDGSFQLLRSNGTTLPGSGSFAASALIASSVNTFTGTITLTAATTYNGQWDGRFYGPSANEVGASFAASNGSGDISVGSIIGRLNAAVSPTSVSKTPLTLTYDSFADLVGPGLPAGDAPAAALAALTAATRTDPADLPRAGAASYSGVLDGRGFVAGEARYQLGGTSAFAVDFGNATVAATLDPVGTHLGDGSVVAFGRYSLGGAIDAAASRFSLAVPASGSRIDGVFMGPQAAAIGATFQLRGTGANPGTTFDAPVDLIGVTVAR